MKKIASVFVLVLAVLSIVGIVIARTFTVDSLNRVVDSESIEKLDRYKNLTDLDLTGSKCYSEITAYMNAHPDVKVRYTVDVGGTEISNGEKKITLKKGQYSVGALTDNLAYLPGLQELELTDMTLTGQQLGAICAKYPGLSVEFTADVGGTKINSRDKKLTLSAGSFDVAVLSELIGYTHLEKLSLPETDLDVETLITLRSAVGELSYSVTLAGKTVAWDVKRIDLTSLAPDGVEKAAAVLEKLPMLDYVELGSEESGITLEQLGRLQKAAPGAVFDYSFDLFGHTVSTADERVEFKNVKIGNKGEERLREILPYMTNCTYFLLDNCKIDNDILAKLREDFPTVNIVWRVFISYLNFLTDVEVIHLTFELTNHNAQVIKYCDKLEYLDIGHNTISDISFCSSLKNLRYLILSYNHVSDISPLAECPKLEMCELYFCFNLKDFSPLQNCRNLKLLNVSATGVRDITPVYEMQSLERFYCIMNYIDEEQQQKAFASLPECWVTFEQNVSKNVGWSFDDVGAVRAQWYLDMKDVLRYRVEDWYFGSID